MTLPTIRTLDELVQLVESDDRNLYVRWSLGPETDLDGESHATSRDALTGIELPGVSANSLRVEPWWGGRPLRLWVARRLYDYRHLRDLRGPGVRRWVRWLNLEPVAAAHTADVLAELAEVVGAALFPIGVEAKGDAIVAIDERGRMFALDQGGEWFLGDTLDEALLSLLTGDGPAERIRDDGTW